MLKGRTVVVGVCGGIAAYKTCEVVSKLHKLGAEVAVVMTENATRFVAPKTFEALSHRPVSVGMFDPVPHFEVEHVSLAKRADLVVVAPATANLVGKMASCVCDDLLTTTLLATRAPILLCPAMNTGMYENPVFTDKLDYLKSKGVRVLEPDEGLLACGDSGKGRLPEPARIVEEIAALLEPRRDFEGKTVLVTAGATVEDIDRVRFISNYSSGKMGKALAEAATARGARVIFVAGTLKVSPPAGCEVVRVKSTEDMLRAVLARLPEADVIIKAAAPADYRVKEQIPFKIKERAPVLEFVKNPDIARECGKVKGERKLVIFCAETDNLLKNAEKKLADKNADMIVANDVTKAGAGFETDTNQVSILTRAGERFDSPLLSKREIADLILDRVLTL